MKFRNLSIGAPLFLALSSIVIAQPSGRQKPKQPPEKREKSFMF
jgi:hypothetical protein